jgi:hypothetical protein
VESLPGKFCPQRSIEGGAEFPDALARGFDGDDEGKSSGFVEKQDDAIEIALAGAASKRQADRMKEFAAPKTHEVFQYDDDLFESLRGKRNAIEQHERKLPHHVASGVTREDGVALNVGENGARVVVKNQMQSIGESATVRNLRTEERGRTLAPRKLSGRDVSKEPALFAQNFCNITAGPSVGGGCGSGMGSFLGWHYEILAHLGGMDCELRHDYR